jgi:hypothetical protein
MVSIQQIPEIGSQFAFACDVDNIGQQKHGENFRALIDERLWLLD